MPKILDPATANIGTTEASIREDADVTERSWERKRQI
jgi:hypothetical protein